MKNELSEWINWRKLLPREDEIDCDICFEQGDIWYEHNVKDNKLVCDNCLEKIEKLK